MPTEPETVPDFMSPPSALAAVVASGMDEDTAASLRSRQVAHALTSGEVVTVDTVRHMVRYFEGADKTDRAWLLYGGATGRAWARRTLRAIEAAKPVVVTRSPFSFLVREAPSDRPDMTTPEGRTRAWVDFITRAHKPAENRLRQRWVGYLKGRVKRTVERLAEVLPKEAAVSGLVVRQVLNASEMSVVLDTAKEAELAAEHIGVQRVRAILRLGWNEQVRAGLDDIVWNPTLDPAEAELARMVTGVDQYTKSQIAKTVQSGLLQGESVNDIQARLIRDPAFSPIRALRIARTETTKLMTKGSNLAYSAAADAGVSFKVGWLSARDGAARSTHWSGGGPDDLDGQQVNPGEEFTLTSGDNAGQTAPGPGEFAAASESVNCRCTTIPVLK
jgi:hypothetical protein